VAVGSPYRSPYSLARPFSLRSGLARPPGTPPKRGPKAAAAAGGLADARLPFSVEFGAPRLVPNRLFFLLLLYKPTQNDKETTRRVILRVTDGGRFSLAVSQIVGKRLTFAEVTGKAGSNTIN
jgi:hypothetical protein